MRMTWRMWTRIASPFGWQGLLYFMFLDRGTGSK